jgi:hypothetical protein
MKLILLIASIILASCGRDIEGIKAPCIVKDVKRKPVISIHDEISPKWIVTTDCRNFSFTSLRSFEVGDTVWILIRK